ncbi:MAG: hypothetical protein IH583_11925, partial [Candidatus Aminicenantes bacterium]|nr:hypothetical protein [Candidatus Aminicenantes bacterium]
FVLFIVTLDEPKGREFSLALNRPSEGPLDSVNSPGQSGLLFDPFEWILKRKNAEHSGFIVKGVNYPKIPFDIDLLGPDTLGFKGPELLGILNHTTTPL